MKSSLFCKSLTLGLATGLTIFASTGAEVYQANCATCHADDGSGATPVGAQLKVRDLRSAEVQKQTRAALIKIVTDGQKAMPAFGTSLSGDEIKNVLQYIRGLSAKH